MMMVVVEEQENRGDMNEQGKSQKKENQKRKRRGVGRERKGESRNKAKKRCSI